MCLTTLIILIIIILGIVEYKHTKANGWNPFNFATTFVKSRESGTEF